jgi:hypothetical protein
MDTDLLCLRIQTDDISRKHQLKSTTFEIRGTKFLVEKSVCYAFFFAKIEDFSNIRPPLYWREFQYKLTRGRSNDLLEYF